MNDRKEVMEIQQLLDEIWPGYKYVSKLGEGSFGKVYRVRREEKKHVYEYAVKVMSIPSSVAELQELYSDGYTEKQASKYFEDLADELIEEIDIMYQLKGNTNIVNYDEHRLVKHEDDPGWDVCLRMEVLKTLYKHFEENEYSNREIAKLGIDICNALEICQKLDIIHRDIKPENIFISDIGNYKLGDFGISKKMQMGTMGMTSQKGTPFYMAPEVRDGKKYDATVDIYSLGIVLYRFLNRNRVPFLPLDTVPTNKDKDNALTMRMQGEKIPKPCNADDALAEIVLKACSYEVKDRYQSAQEMRMALETVYSELSVTPLNTVVVPEVEPTPDFDPFVIPEKYPLEMTGEMPMDEDVHEDVAETELHKEDDKTVRKPRPKKDKCLGETVRKPRPKPESVKAEEVEIPKQEPVKKAEKVEIPKTEPVKSVQKTKPSKKEVDKKKTGLIAVIAVVALLFGIVVLNIATKTKVPEVTGSNYEEAMQLLENSSLKVVEGERIYSDDFRKDTIISVENEGKRVKKNSTVEIIVSLGAEILVEDMLGWKKEEAKQILESKGVIVEIKTDYSNEYEDGCVMEQSVEAGTTIYEEDIVALTISEGAKPFEIAKYVGKSLEAAQKDAEELGLIVKVERKNSSKVDKGDIISQTPKAGTTVKKGDTVTFVVSKGPVMVKVPDLYGKSESEARQALEKAGLKLGSVHTGYSSSVSENLVMGQSKSSGSSVAKGSSVDITISKGKEPVYQPSTPKPDPNPAPDPGDAPIVVPVPDDDSDDAPVVVPVG